MMFLQSFSHFSHFILYHNYTSERDIVNQDHPCRVLMMFKLYLFVPALPFLQTYVHAYFGFQNYSKYEYYNNVCGFYLALLDDHFDFCYHKFIFSYDKPYI